MKKALTIIMAVGLLAATLTGVSTAAGDDNDAPPKLPQYMSVTGTVLSVEEIENGFVIKIEDEHGHPATLIVNDSTAFPFESEVNVGDTVTGYYLSNLPMILIWPPQYAIHILVAGIPEGLDFNPEEQPTPVIDASGWPIYIDGELLEAPEAFQLEDGTVMVPLRAIAEALGYDVNWDNELRSVRLGVAIHLWIDNTEVHIGRMAPLHISAAPQIVNDRTYVPLDFLRNVLGAVNAFAFEGRIEIHTEGEAME